MLEVETLEPLDIDDEEDEGLAENVILGLQAPRNNMCMSFRKWRR